MQQYLFNVRLLSIYTHYIVNMSTNVNCSLLPVIHELQNKQTINFYVEIISKLVCQFTENNHKIIYI